MLENKELYSYIVSSINILNKSLLLNEQNTVKLFSYLYNNYTEDTKIITDLENCIVKLNSDIKDINKKIDNINNDINNIRVDMSNEIIATPVILIPNDISRLEKLKKILYKKLHKTISNIKEYYHKIYKKIYNIIFKKKILRLQEEERIRKEKEAQQKAIEENIKRKEIIKQILKKCN